MRRIGNSFSVVLVLVLAAGVGTGVAFLKPASKRFASAAAPASQAKVLTSKAVSAPVVALPTIPAPISKLRSKTAKLPEPPAFIERDGGVFEASTPGYMALLSAGEGLRYMPKSSDGTLTQLGVKLTSVRRGEAPLFERDTEANAETDLGVPKGAGGISYWRSPAFEECYEPRGNGIEQSFVLDALPGGEGALDFSFDVQTTGLTPLPARASRRGGILFAEASGKIAEIGRASCRERV